MKSYPSVSWLRILTAVFTSAVSLCCRAQTAPAGVPAANPDPDVTVLSAFKVSEDSTSTYQAKQANSAGRIATALIDTPQSVDVITSDFMDDIGTDRLLDAMKFAASVTESNFPNRLGRITLRGFQQDAAQQSFYIDGFRYSAISGGYNADGSNLDRIEIVKGPNAILAAAGSPGGSINEITKSPQFQASGSIMGEYGAYLSNRAQLDITGPLPFLGGQSIAYRLIVMDTDARGFQDNQFNKALLVDPSLTLRIGKDTELTIKGHLDTTDVAVLNLPLSPYATAATPFELYPGLTRTWSGTGGFQPSEPGGEERVLAQLTHKFGEDFQARLGIMTSVLYLDSLQDGGIGGITTQVGNINPTTGLYTPGTTWTVYNYDLPTQYVTSAPAAFPDFTNRSNGFTDSVSRQFNVDYLFNLQNDYVFNHKLSDFVTSTTVAGASFFRHRYDELAYPTINVPLIGTIDNPNYLATYSAASNVTRLKSAELGEIENTRQAYVSELLKMDEDKIFLSGSISRMGYGQEEEAGSITTSTTLIGPLMPVTTPGFASGTYYVQPGYAALSNAKNDYAFGLLYKPVKWVGAYVSHSTNTNPPTLNSLPTTSQNQYGVQNEVGVKTSPFNGAIDLSLDYFDVVQHNVSTYDITSNTFIPLGTTTSKGWELEANGKITQDFSVIGAVSLYKARNGFNQYLRAAPDQSGSLALRYQFNSGALKSLWFMLSADYLGKRAGENPTTINIDKASANPAVLADNGSLLPQYPAMTLNGGVVLPTFWLPARTIATLNGGYRLSKNWKFWYKIDNLTNRDYIQASLSRGTLYPGAPRNLTGSVTYSF